VHEAETVNETLVLAVTARAPSLSSVVPDAHPALVRVVDKALAYEREARFQSAAELREAVREADAAIASDETPPSLRVPLLSAARVSQTSAPGSTATGLVASVRSVPSQTPRRRGRVAVISLSLCVLTVGGWLVSGVAHRPRAVGGRDASAVAAPLAAGSPLVNTVAAAVPAPSASAAEAPARAAEEPARGIPTSRPSAPRKATAAGTRSGSSKQVAVKSAAELLKKRH